MQTNITNKSIHLSHMKVILKSISLIYYIKVIALPMKMGMILKIWISLLGKILEETYRIVYLLIATYLLSKSIFQMEY